ncbi:MAG: hypothetical protein ABI576_01400 [Flavobacterium sp.]
MRIVNTFFIFVITVITGFLSIFYLGTYERKMQLINELPFSFIYRFLSVSVIGLIGVIILLLINFLVDKLILKDVNISKLRELAVKALVPVILVALFGVLVFFFL